MATVVYIAIEAYASRNTFKSTTVNTLYVQKSAVCTRSKTYRRSLYT